MDQNLIVYESSGLIALAQRVLFSGERITKFSNQKYKNKIEIN
jgi:hypothetical protein